MTYSLICEGACNPQRLAIDQRVSSFRRGACDYGVLSPPPDQLIAQLRTLRATPHEVNPNTSLFTCMECGTPRRYGQVA